MNVFLATLQTVGILLGIGFLGFWIIARRIVSPDILKVLSPLVIDIAVPCMVFTDIITRFEPSKFEGWWTLPLWWAGFTVFSGLFTFASMRFFPKDSRCEAGLGLLYPNAVFTPIVIIPGIFGLGSPLLVGLYLYTLLFPFFLFNSSEIIFGTDKSKKKFGFRNLLNPILIATVLAVTIKLTNLASFVPDVLLSITRSVGGIAFPLIMILIGGNIYMDMRAEGKLHLPQVLMFILFKNILLPAVTLFILALIKPAFNVAFLVFIVSAVPPVTMVPILAQRLKANVALTDQFLVGSFLFSLVTLPLAIWAFGLVFMMK